MTKTRAVMAVIFGALSLLIATPVYGEDYSVSSTVINGTSEVGGICTGPTLYALLNDANGYQVGCQSSQAPSAIVGVFGTKTYLRLGGDTTMHAVQGCQPATCRISMADDVIVTKQRVNPLTWSIVLYNHVLQRLHTLPDGSFSLDMTAPDYTAWTNTGDVLPVGGIALSPNGKWLGMEVVGGGFAVMDIKTFEIVKVNNTTYRYGYGMDPTADMAVADDGKTLVLTGYNVDDLIVSVDESCGVNLARLPITAPTNCPSYNLWSDLTGIANGFRYAAQPWIDDGTVTLQASYWPGQVRLVTIRQQGEAQHSTLDYLALGDSYTSGEGETSDSFYVAGTNEADNKCHLSRRSYPYLVATLNVPAIANVHSVACSGATIRDITADDSYKGQNNRLGSYSPSAKSALQRAALDTFLPGDIPQAAFIERYRPRVATVGVGGNDAGLMDKLRACIMPDECEWVSPKGRTQVAQEVGSLFNKLVDLYQELHRRSPQTQLYAVGYPAIIDPNGQCDLLTSTMLTANERQFLAETLNYLNQVIQAAAQKAGVPYISIEEAYGSHRLCGGDSNAALNLIQFGDDVAPIPKLPNLIFIGNESFHPTPLGHQLAAAEIHRQQNDLYQAGACGVALCPQDVSLPIPSRYWAAGGDSEPQLVATSFVESGAAQLGSLVEIHLPAGSFMPSSSLQIEVHSTSTTLSTGNAADDGSSTLQVVVPPTLEEGYHTFHLIGTSYTGNPIDRYQTVWVGERLAVDQALSRVVNKEQALPTQVSGLPTIGHVGLGTPLPIDGGSLPQALPTEVKGAAIERPLRKASPTETLSYVWRLMLVVVVISVVGVAVIQIIVRYHNKGGAQ